MVAGFERYFQIARCFRDEDLRADRQPEFTQLDIEMSFVDAEDVIDAERAPAGARARRVAGIEVALPFPRITYDEAMARYGTDKPDLRFGLELIDLTDALRETEFKVFRGAIDGGGGRQGAERRRARAAARGARRADRRGPGARRQGARLGVPRGRRLALADREVPHRRRARAR